MNITSIKDIKQEQTKHQPPAVAHKDKEEITRIEGKIWIPNESANLKLNIAVQAHYGEKGHRENAATLEIVGREHWCEDMKADIKEFTQECIHCLVSQNGERVPRPLSTALHGERPNEVVHADFIYMGPAEKRSLKYILIIKDEFSSYTWLYPTDNADSDAGTPALGKWITCFGEMNWLVTDDGSYFKSSLMNNLASRMHINHHFTTAYCPWSNGTVERVCKEVLRAARSLLSEWKMSVGQWPTIVDVIQRVINHSPTERLRKNEAGSIRCPMEVFLGLKPSPLIAVPIPLRRYRDLKSLTKEKCRQIVNINNIHDSLERMRREAAASNRKRRTLAQRSHNAKTNILTVNFEVRLFVMIRTHAKRNHKLEAIWRGPMKVVSFKSDLVFVLDDIVKRLRQVVHAQRVIHYPSNEFGNIASHELKEQATHYDARYHLVKDICGVSKRRGQFKMMVSWRGFEGGQDKTWEPLARVMEDMPGILEDYLHSPVERKI